MPSQLRNALESLLLLLVSIVFALGAVELVMLYVVEYPRSFPAVGMVEPDAERTYRLAPNFRGSFLKGGLRFEVATNAAGFRDPRDFAALDPRTPRILAIGDSCVFGMPVEQEETFVAVLEREISAAPETERWQVLNLGVPSYNTHQEALVLEQYAPELEPRAVLLGFFMGNDFEDNTFEPDASRYRVHGGTQVTQQAAEAAALPFGEIEFQFNLLLARSATYNFVRHRLKSGKAKDAKVRTPESIQRTYEALDRIQAYCEAYGIELLVLVIPEKRDVLAASDDPTRTALVALLAERGVAHYDPTPELRARTDVSDYFETHGSHFTARGNEWIGRRLAERFLSSGWL